MIPSPEAAFLVCIKALNRGIEFVCIEKELPTYAYHLESGNDHQGARDTVHQEFSLFLGQAGLEASPQILVPLELEEWAKENELAEFGEVALYPDNACDLALGGLQAAVLGTPVEGSNLLPAELRRSRDKKPAWLATSLGIIGLLLFLAYIFSGLHGKSRQLDQLERMISEKKKLAQEVAGLKEENRKVGEQIRDLRSLLPPVSFLETLQSLTGTIPPLGWINEFTWNDQEVTLYGFAPSASDLLLLLEKSSLLREVSFVSPTQRVGDLEQFRIKGKLVENRPQEAEK
jgi:Tfp pilus assembly protein PilN